MTALPLSQSVFGIEAMIVGLAALVVGYLVALAVGTLFEWNLDGIHYAGLSLVSLATVVLLLMVAQIASGGAIFSHPGVVQGVVATLVAASLVVIVFGRVRLAATGWKAWSGLCLVCAGAAAMWCPPIFSVLPVGYTGDTRFHLIEAAQLLDGASNPSTYVIGQAPNGYPWLFHALLAFFSAFTPGGRAIEALSPVMVTLVMGGAAAFCALGRELTRRITGGFFTSLFASMAGGIGFLLARGPALVPPRSGFDTVSTSSDHFAGDFVMVRSYNFAFHNLAPPLPRDLCFALLGGFLFLLIIGVERKASGLLLLAGLTAGLIGVTGGESFFIAIAVEVGAIVVGDFPRMRLAILLLLPTLTVYSLWAGPVVYNYFAFGGFNDLSDQLVALPPGAILGAWGVVTPLAALGAWYSFRRLRVSMQARLMVVVLAATATCLVGASVASRVLGPGFQTLGRAHRYWPLFYLALALYAAVGVDSLLDASKESLWRAAAWFVAVLVVAGAVISPVLGTMRYPEIAPRNPVLSATLSRSRTPLNLLSPRPGGDCAVAVPRRLAQVTSIFSGYRVLFIPGSARHLGRLRYKAVAGFASKRARRMLNTALLKQPITPAVLHEARSDFGIDAFVRLGSAPAPPRGLEVEPAADKYEVVWIDRSCLAE